MDGQILAIVLALTLASTGAMFLVIARQVLGRSGMAVFAVGLALFGLAFAIPDHAHEPTRLAKVVGVVADTTAVAAVLLLQRGLLAFMQRREIGWSRIGAVLAAFVVASAVARALFEVEGARVTVNATLALLFAWLAWQTQRDAGHDAALLRMPLLLMSGVLAVLAVLIGGAGVAEALGQISPTVAAWYDAVLMFAALLLGPTLLWMHSLQLTQQLKELSTRDALTRLLNERGLHEGLRRHFTRRQNEPLVILLVDVDEFGRVNRLHGEAAGDNLLRMIALALEGSLRSDDFVARVGGEEFAVSCASADVNGASMLGSRLRDAVRQMQTGLSERGEPLRCTVSIGLSNPFDRLDDWRRAWDEAALALAAAKAEGGDCVVFATPQSSPADDASAAAHATA